jgi:hypothetical protein
MQLSPPQSLISINIPNTRHQSLIQQSPLDLSPPTPQSRNHSSQLKPGLQRIPSDMRNRLRHHPERRIHQLGHSQPTESTLVDEPQLRTVIGENEPNPQMRLVGIPDLPDQQLTTHPQMSENSIPGRVERRAAKLQPQILPTPPSSGNGTPGQPALEVGGTRQVPPNGSRMQDLDFGDGAADSMLGHTTPDNLNLRKLWHD